MDTMTTDTADLAAHLNQVALKLLDITFEPASVSSGERFDLVVEALSDHLSDTATALFAGVTPRSFTPPVLPVVPSATTRRAQAALRRAVDDGALPGSSRSLHACHRDLVQARETLVEVMRQYPGPGDDALTPCLDALGRLAHVVDIYTQGYDRVRAALGRPGCSREAAADSATRSERALLRCLDRCGDTRSLR